MMNKNRILLVSLIVGGVAFASCSMGSKGNKGEVLPKAEEKQALAGADKDEHGCILSAGYCWSEALKDCVRLWEAGVRMDVMKDGKVDKDATSSGFLVFAKDS